MQWEKVNNDHLVAAFKALKKPIEVYAKNPTGPEGEALREEFNRRAGQRQGASRCVDQLLVLDRRGEIETAAPPPPAVAPSSVNPTTDTTTASAARGDAEYGTGVNAPPVPQPPAAGEAIVGPAGSEVASGEPVDASDPAAPVAAAPDTPRASGATVRRPR